MNWKHKLKIKHLFTENEDPESVDKSMRAIAEVIKQSPFMAGFDITDFYNCLEEEDSCNFANQLLDDLYDYADFNKIWVE
jgi:hypothetical protein